YIVQHMMEEEFPSLDETWASAGSDSHLVAKVQKFLNGEALKMIDGELDEIRVKRDIAFYYRMGFDYLPDLGPWHVMCTMFGSLAAERGLASSFESHAAPDTADTTLSRGVRNWMEEKVGFVASWEDFERVPWERMDLDMLGLDEYYAFIARHLPDGMKVTALGCSFGPLVTTLGFETMCELLYEDPALVKAVAEKWGQLNLELYERMLPHKCVGFAWQADDLGYKTQTLLSPEHLREYVLPWFSRYADLAHQHGKMYWLHSCGDIYGIMEDLIEDVGIDAQQSFQDAILPINDFMDRYGHRIAGLGGVDMDKLCRLKQKALRDYCRSILDHCMPKGRFAYGTGNSVANYIPLQNYLAMMEVGYQYCK
ncbi:uroporphyrinogen decarboxylase family protein, partial [Candidatus Bipolaricaulota bacterium]